MTAPTAMRTHICSLCNPSPARSVAAGRAGWVGTRNFEVDSGAYYLSLLFNFHSAVGRARAADTLTRPEVRRMANHRLNRRR